LPAFAFNLVLGEVSTVVLDGQRVLPQKLQTLNYPFQYLQAEAALSNLLR
jgi:NAD dependent epimerase/dehydratase family enzyme